jgi:hypothetical protein
MFIVNQSVADFAVSMLLLTPIYVGRNMRHDNAWDQFVCRFHLSGFFFYTSLFSSTYSILALTAERYLAVIYPVIHKVRIEIIR